MKKIFAIFSIASVINKIMVVVYHLLVCPWISVEKIILSLANFFISVFPFRFFKENSEIQDGCRGHMTTPFHQKIPKNVFTWLYQLFMLCK
jgi:hypothetical protein